MTKTRTTHAPWPLQALLERDRNAAAVYLALRWLAKEKRQVGTSRKHIGRVTGFYKDTVTTAMAALRDAGWIGLSYGRDGARTWYRVTFSTETPLPVPATADEAEIEDLVYHFMDDAGSPFVDFVPFRTAPMPVIEQVTNVLTHGGAGDFACLLYEWGPSNDIEPRAPGVSHLEVAFNGAMDALTATDPGNVEITGGSTGPYPGALTLDLLPDPEGDTLVIGLDQPLPDGDCYTVDLTGIVSIDGADILNPTFTIRPLAGDIDRNGIVTTGDASIIKPRFGEVAGPDNFLFDFDCSGLVSTGDFSQIKPNFGHTAAECP